MSIFENRFANRILGTHSTARKPHLNPSKNSNVFFKAIDTYEKKSALPGELTNRNVSIPKKSSVSQALKAANHGRVYPGVTVAVRELMDDRHFEGQLRYELVCKYPRLIIHEMIKQKRGKQSKERTSNNIRNLLIRLARKEKFPPMKAADGLLTLDPETFSISWDPKKQTILHESVTQTSPKKNPFLAYALKNSNLNPLNKEGFTPLQWAIDREINNDTGVNAFEELLNAGANPNALGIYNTTALHEAAKHLETVSPSMVKALREAGADPTLENLSGKTPLQIAKKKLRDIDPTDHYYAEYLEIIELLKPKRTVE
jgi:hypothetical protein